MEGGTSELGEEAGIRDEEASELEVEVDIEVDDDAEPGSQADENEIGYWAAISLDPGFSVPILGEI